jgi:hypothetical protein
MILLSAAIFAAIFQAAAQTLEIDPARDRAFHALVQAFLDDTVTPEQLDTDLREYVAARITLPAQQAFFKGELTAAEAAVKMAPFVLIWRGYGMDPPDASPLTRERTQELMREIGEFAASEDDFVFGQIAEVLHRPAVLDAPAGPLELKVGELFPLDRIVIVARDEVGTLLGPVPIAIEVDDTEPPLLNTRSDAIAESKLQPLRPGSFRFRARTICPYPSIHLLVPASIR